VQLRTCPQTLASAAVRSTDIIVGMNGASITNMCVGSARCMCTLVCVCALVSSATCSAHLVRACV